jgi:hypothetical protein
VLGDIVLPSDVNLQRRSNSAVLSEVMSGAAPLADRGRLHAKFDCSRLLQRAGILEERFASHEKSLPGSRQPRETARSRREFKICKALRFQNRHPRLTA